ncbi:MAG TPA: ice-binding family protein [Lacisediminihabitans sp.]|uniref:ice-binding family protein n=1 Tax=Lacisediminihabitans sp. TaxID=2787631 RepID=UPI002EDBACB1
MSLAHHTHAARSSTDAPRRWRVILPVTAIAGMTALVVLGSAGPASAAGSTQAAVGLGTADSYEVLAGSTVTNTGATTVENGDVGLSPGTAVTGFPPGVIANGVIHAADAQAQQAQADLTTAYNDAAGRSPDESGIIDLAGRTLVPGVYSGNALALNGTVTLDGSASSVFIFQAASTLITASASTVAFTGGANSCNVFWQVGSSATLGTGSTFAGTIMALTSITANTNATIDGRLLARNGAVTLDSDVITRPASCGPRTGIVASTPTPEQIAAAQAAAAQAAAAQAAAAAAAAAAARTGAPSGSLAESGSDLLPATAVALILATGGALIWLRPRRWRIVSAARSRR